MSKFNFLHAEVAAPRHASVIPLGDDPPSRSANDLASMPPNKRRPRRVFIIDQKLTILAEVDVAPRGGQGATLQKHPRDARIKQLEKKRLLATELLALQKNAIDLLDVAFPDSSDNAS